MSEWVTTHGECPKCGSSDAFSVNTEGWGKCFSCDANIKMDGEYEPSTSAPSNPDLLPFGEYKPLQKRGITLDTCKKFGYFIGTYRGGAVQVAPFRNQEGKVAAQKIRTPSKDFIITGDFKNVQLFGQHLWGSGGKRVVITEGEIDCLTVSQLQGNKWPVVSTPNGVKSAIKSVRANLEWLLSFDEIVVLFDMDDVGIEAAKAVAELLPVGKAKIATLSMKDPNELLMAGKGEEVLQAIWNAKEFRPDGIVDIDEILDDIEKPIERGLPWFLPTLTDKTFGRREGEIYALGAGTGIGKTDLMTQQIAFDVTTLRQRVGVIFLEAKPVEVGKRIAGKIDGARYHIPDSGWDVEQLKVTLSAMKGMVTFYDSWGSSEWEVVSNKIRYMVVSKGIKLIYLDHLTALADTSNEKESIEQIMKEMAGLANELSCIIHFVSHLATPEGKSHEEGGRVSIKHFKGSRSIGFWSFFMFGLERNQQAEDEEERQITTLRILKDRYTGQATGVTIQLGFDTKTGRLYEYESGYFDEHEESTSDF